MKKMIGVVVLGIALMAPLGVEVADAEASTHSTVLCAKDGIHDLLVRKPRNCAFNARTQTNAYMTHVQNMRWRNWGGPASCGRETLRANSGYRAPLRFCLYQPRVWEEGIYRYTRLRGVVGKGCAWTDHYECGIKPYRRHIRVVV
jgi:hypothetical protein